MRVELKDLLLELEDLLRTMPDKTKAWHTDEELDWLGRAEAVLSMEGVDQPVAANIARTKAINYRASISAEGKTELQILLNTARHKIRMQTVGPLSVAVDKGMVFDYFDGLRKIVEEARSDIFFIDPYLDVDFVSNYLPFVNNSVTTRLLCGKRFPNVIAAAQLFAAQHNLTIEVKRSNAIHDRFVFIDGKRGFQSGASFHQGGVKSPSILTEVTDTLSSTRQIYENIWKAS